MTPTIRAAVLAGCLALMPLVAPLPVALVVFLAGAVVVLVDMIMVRSSPTVVRTVPRILSRGVAAPLTVNTSGTRGSVRVRQPSGPDLRIFPQESDVRLEASLTPLRRGKHTLPAVATRTTGVLGLGAAHHRLGDGTELLVYPALPAAHRLVHSVRKGKFVEEGRRRRGPLGLGTEFESIREYSPDDDIRQVNWRATARVGRPMSNQFRVEQDRDVIILIDAGRLMATPLDHRTRLDAAVDAAVAVALVADEMGDRAGVIAFDSNLLRRLPPSRAGGDAVVRTIFDLEPSDNESNYEIGFQAVAATKRAFVLVLTDIINEAAARSLLAATPVLARRHVVAVASALDDELEEMLVQPPERVEDVFRAVAALDVLNERSTVTRRLRHMGADVVESQVDQLSAQCVAAYLRAKARARL